MTAADALLAAIIARWQPFLLNGDEHALSQAITISASYHPLIHFFEASLNTELAMCYLAQNQPDDAERCAQRAVFLDHQHPDALCIVQGTAPRQRARQISRWYDATIYSPKGWQLAMANHAYFTEADQAFTLASHQKWAEAIAHYERIIPQAKALHDGYHKAAATPWLMRAEHFNRLQQPELAANDQRRARDLDETVARI